MRRRVMGRARQRGRQMQTERKRTAAISLSRVIRSDISNPVWDTNPIRHNTISSADAADGIILLCLTRLALHNACWEITLHHEVFLQCQSQDEHSGRALLLQTQTPELAARGLLLRTQTPELAARGLQDLFSYRFWNKLELNAAEYFHSG